MPNKLFQRASALGTALALGVTTLVATPAQAVDDLSLTSYWGAGKSNDFVAVTKADNGYVLSTEIANVGSGSAANLKYLVEIVNDNTDYENVNAGTGDNDANFNDTNRIEFYSNLSDRLDGAGDDLSAHTATENTVTANDNKVVVTPVYKDASTVAVSAATASGIDTATHTLAMTVAAGHDFTVGDVVVVAGVAGAGTGTPSLAGTYTVSTVGGTTITASKSGSTPGNADNNAAATVTSATVRLSAAITAAVGQNHLLYIEAPAAFDDYDADTTADDTLTIKVTAWIDQTSDNAIGNEYKSSTVTLTFLPEKSVDVTSSWDYAFVGQTADVSGQFTLNVNNRNWFNVSTEQLAVAGASGVNVDLTGAALDANESDVAVTFNSTLDQMEFASAVAGTVVALNAGALTANIQVASANITGGSSTYFVGNTDDTSSTVTYTVGSNAITAAGLKVTTSATVAEDNDLIGGSGNVVAATGTTALSWKVEAKTGSTTFAGAGVAVSVTLTDNGLGDTVVTSNSKTLRATGDDSVTFQLLTGADGIASFSTAIAGNVAEDGNNESFTVSVRVEDQTDSTTVKFQDEVVSVLATPETSAKIATGGSISGQFRIVNQWGQVPSGTYRAVITRANSSGDRDLAAEQASFVYEITADATGRGSFTLTDNGKATVEGVDQISVQAQKMNSTGGGYSNKGSADTFLLTYEIDLATATLSAQADNNGVVLYGTTTKVSPIALEPETLKSFDGRVDKLSSYKYTFANKFASTTATASGTVTLTGQVLDATNAGISGVPVKVAGTGMLFLNTNTTSVTNASRAGFGEYVANTDSTGSYTVYVLGNAAGTRTVTISVGKLTKTVELKFATDGTVADFTVTSASTAEPGRTVDVLVSAKDKFGGAAAGASVTLSSTGPGYLINTSGTTLADGTFSTKLLLGSNDTGSAVVKVTMTVDGVATSKSVTIAVGAAEATAVVGSFNGRVAVRVENAKGSTVSVKIGKSWYKYTAISNNYLQSWKSRKGTSVAVSVYVDGELQNVQTITVK